ncbi:MAG: squalene/phytoene synthase family protein [Rudaea sp.]
MAEKDAAFISFEQKWLEANPEQSAVSIYLDPARRDKAQAFGTLIHEIAHTTFSVREPQVAAAKLGWWQQELANAAMGNARHPISREWYRVTATSIDNDAWDKLIGGALAQLDAPPPANFEALRLRLAEFYGPVAVVESAMNAESDSDALASLWIASHLLAMFRASPSENLALPLDLLARHGVSRADFAQAGQKTSAVLREFLARVREMIAHNLPRVPASHVGRRVRARLDMRLIDGAIRAHDPAAYLATRYHRIRWRSTWLAWREARAAQKHRLSTR